MALDYKVSSALPDPSWFEDDSVCTRKDSISEVAVCRIRTAGFNVVSEHFDIWKRGHSIYFDILCCFAVALILFFFHMTFLVY